MEIKVRVIPDEVLKNLDLDPQTWLAVAMSLTTALRVTELVTLRVEHLLNGGGKVREIVKVKCKGRNVWRNVYIPPGLGEDIKRFINTQLDGATEGYLFRAKKRFVNQHEWPHVQRQEIARRFRVAQNKAGQDVIYRWHDLRHTAITRYYKHTQDIIKTQRFAGHANVTTTQIYAHPDEHEINQAVNDLYEKGREE